MNLQLLLYYLEVWNQLFTGLFFQFLFKSLKFLINFYFRGDLLFLTNYREEPVRVGDIVVFKVEGRDIPIVHRVIKLHEKSNGTVKFLTKGDNNSVDDRGLYAPGQLWLTKKDIVGRARGFLPYVGMITIYMNEYPNFKYAILGILAVYVLLHRE